MKIDKEVEYGLVGVDVEGADGGKHYTRVYIDASNKVNMAAAAAANVEVSTEAQEVNKKRFLVSVQTCGEYGNGEKSARVENAQQAAQFAIDVATQNFDLTVTNIYIKKFGKGFGEYYGTDADITAINAMVDPAGLHIYEQYKELRQWMSDYIDKCDCTEEQAEQAAIELYIGKCEDMIQEAAATNVEVTEAQEVISILKLEERIIKECGEGTFIFSHAEDTGGGIALHFDFIPRSEFGKSAVLVEVFTDGTLARVEEFTDGNHRVYTFVNGEEVTYFNDAFNFAWSEKYGAGYSTVKQAHLLVKVPDGQWFRFKTFAVDDDEFFKLMAERGACTLDTEEPQPKLPTGDKVQVIAQDVKAAKPYSINPAEDETVRFNHLNIYFRADATLELEGHFECQKIETAYRRFKKAMAQAASEVPELKGWGDDNAWPPAKKLTLTEDGDFWINENDESIFYTRNGEETICIDINEDIFYVFGYFRNFKPAIESMTAQVASVEVTEEATDKPQTSNETNKEHNRLVESSDLLPQEKFESGSE